jgi:hypothetical protein
MESRRRRQRNDLTASERFARDVVEHHLAVVLVGHDDGSENMMVDLIFARPGRSPHLGVEETSPRDHRRAAFLSAAKWLDSKNMPTLRFEWWVQFPAHVNVKKEMPGLVRLLEELEAAGIEKAKSDAGGDGWTHIPRLAHHGVRYALRAREIGPPGRIRPMANGIDIGAGDDPEAIVQYAERVAAADAGNLKKLRASGLDDLHLFVRALGQRPVGIALENRRTPSRDPRLLAPLTGIWIAGDTERSPIAFFHRDHGWALVDPPDYARVARRNSAGGEERSGAQGEPGSGQLE